MYSIVLMAALSTGSATPDFFWHHHHHCGCYGCGCYSCGYSGCGYCGCCGCGCYGCYGCGCCGCGCYGCGCYGCGCGCCGCYGNYGHYCSWNCHGCYNGYSCYAAPLQGPAQVAPIGPGPGPVAPPLPNPPLGTDVPPPVEPKKAIELPPVEPKKELPKIEIPKEEPKKPISSNSTARVIVDLPAEAKLFVDGQPTRTTAGHRVFRTPELEPGQTYFYELRAEVEQNGQIVTQTRRLVVRGGETAQASFADLQAQPNATAAQK